MPATMSTGRIGARRMSEIPPRVLAQLNRGEIESRTLVETLAVDFCRLLRTVAPRLPKPSTDTMAAAREVGITKRMELAGRLLLSHYGPPGYFYLARHHSDTVRGWAAFLLSASPDFTLGERLHLIRALANDHNSGVREWAWLAMRPHVAANVELAIDLLEPWTVSVSPFQRRFASEATRPRGVWCSRIKRLVEKPELGLRILEPLRADPHRYVQDSVANWLNDAAKSQPVFVRGLCDRWRKESANGATDRICRRAMRSLSES
jgi:3-methyladenine DNA glycosylase AlkC